MRGLVWIVFLYGCEAGKASSEEAEENTSLDSEEDLEQDTGDESQEVELSCPEDLEGGVLTTSGCMVGTEMEYSEGFLGVPYAQPPLGDLRWQRPHPIEPWEEPFSADSFSDYCIQGWTGLDDGEYVGTGAEDCLTLNLLRPLGSEAGAGLPILFFTHGGQTHCQ